MGLSNLNPNDLFATLLAFVVAITVHEFAHAYIADQMGDRLPRQQGRVTLDPRSHVDPLGLLMIVIAGFGWGRPVYHTIRDRRQRLWVSLAGPMSNVLLAVLFGVFFRLGLGDELFDMGPAWFNLGNLTWHLVSINALLAVFNLIPLAPLDGSSVFAGLLPSPYGEQLESFNYRYPYALFFFLILNLVISQSTGFSILGRLLGPPIEGLLWIATGF